jgi:hypothetical protein
MLGSLSALVLALLPLAYAQDLDPNTVLSSLKSSKVIPDVIPANFTPRFPIEVVFTDKNSSRFPVTAGANLTISRSSLFLTFKPNILLTISYRNCQHTFIRHFVQQHPNNRKTIPHSHNRS